MTDTSVTIGNTRTSPGTAGSMRAEGTAHTATIIPLDSTASKGSNAASPRP